MTLLPLRLGFRFLRFSPASDIHHSFSFSITNLYAISYPTVMISCAPSPYEACFFKKSISLSTLKEIALNIFRFVCYLFILFFYSFDPNLHFAPPLYITLSNPLLSHHLTLSHPSLILSLLFLFPSKSNSI